MQINRSPVESGWGWFGDGWKLFGRFPGLWIALLLVMFVIYLGSGLVPLIGGLAVSLLAPVFTGGIMFGAREVEAGRNLELAHLFRGFSEDGKLGPLMLLGVLSLGLSIVSFVVLAVTLGGALAVAAGSAGIDFESLNERNFDPQLLLQHLTISAPLLVGLFLFLALVAAITMAMLYAPALVMLGGSEPVAAMITSFRACIANWLPLLVFGLLYLVLAVVAIIPFGLGLLILVPVVVCALYCSYRDIFSNSAAAQAFRA